MTDRLYELLPTLYRVRDAAQGEPLRALMQVIGEQAQLLEDDLRQAYDNWFIETCEPWVVPYIADLLGHVPVQDAAVADGDTSADLALSAVLTPRREVANTLRYRRRKGSLALLELLAVDVAGWPARAVEYAPLLRQTASLRLLRAGRGRLVDLRCTEALQTLGTPLDGLAHGPDVRRLESAHGRGLHGGAKVAVHVWRLQAQPVTRAPAACREDVGPHCFTFSALGNDAPLFNRPLPPGCDAAHPGDVGLPVAITRARLAAPRTPGERLAAADERWYGLARDADGREHAQSLAIWAPGWPPAARDKAAAASADDDRLLPIPAHRILVADLSGWAYQPPRDHVLVDPVRGRLMFPPRQIPRRQVVVSYHQGVVAELGGDEYPRVLQQHDGAEVIRVTGTAALRDALRRWQREDDGQGLPIAPADQPAHAVIELGDSGVYVLPVAIWLAPGHTLQIRAAQRARPVLRLLDWQVDRSDNLLVSGGKGSRFTLDGVLVTGRGLQVEGAIASVTLRHATLVPGWSLDGDCCPCRPSEPSIEVIDSGACLVIERSIVGSIQVNNDERRTDPLPLRITDSIVDATCDHGGDSACEAIGAAGSRSAFVTLQIERSTVIGRTMVHAIERAQDAIFTGCVSVARRQVGCLRFSYVPTGSRTPRRYLCQPDGVLAAVQREGEESGATAAAIAEQQRAERLRVRPRFDSTRYGQPAYARLAAGNAPEILRGAGDESEMGAYQHLHQPQRLASLATRLEEFTPAASDAGVVFAD